MLLLCVGERPPGDQTVVWVRVGRRRCVCRGPHRVLRARGSSECWGLERWAWRQWGSVCGGEHSGQSPEGQGAESQRRQEEQMEWVA